MDENSWKPLLSEALTMLDELREQGLGVPGVVFGGGTVLMMRLRHRLSKDIDLFLHDAQWLGLLTPRLNDRVATRIADYSEQANSLKLVLPGGDIDFVVAGVVTRVEPTERLAFAGWSLPLESTEEILAKKLYFRAGLLKPRDVFDLVAAQRIDPNAVRRAVAASAPRRGEQLRRLGALASLPPEALSADIAALGDYVRLLPTLCADARAILEAGA
ncbi:MAG TPA: nucleotidyl transferase AbiEii/AbiGii toxin family protein [Roseiarcus sp.]|nr:nucleotidyl transferase AbiEii/AbiGii toxin family protein [Roseiarcus sp.]